MCRDLNISNDDFIRTTEPRHHRGGAGDLARVATDGDIYKGDYEGWYCTVDEIFVPETQLVDGKCPTCGSKVERLKEESYYFRLSKYQQPLLDFYAANPDFVQPAFRLNEVRTFVEAGLQDLSISRTSFTWGIPVPGDPKHVMYVWFDALTNYLTALGFGSGRPEAEARIARYWPTVTHFVGKEIVRQHALYWPAFLMSAGLTPPRRIIAHGWWLMGGAKMSKSVGNVARYQDYAAGLRRGRAALLRHARDAARPGRQLLGRGHPDAVQRRPGQRSRQPRQPRDDDDPALPRRRGSGGAAGTGASRWIAISRRRSTTAIDAVKANFEAFQISLALQDTWELIGTVNKYIVEREPWTLAKDADERRRC